MSVWTHSKQLAIPGELVSKASTNARQRTEDAFGSTTSASCGRKVDLSIRIRVDNQWKTEIAIFEFKPSSSTPEICEKQQQKSVRINAAILLDLESRGLNIDKSYQKIAEGRALGMDFYTLRRYQDVLGAGRSPPKGVSLPSQVDDLKAFLESDTMITLLAFREHLRRFAVDVKDVLAMSTQTPFGSSSDEDTDEDDVDVDDVPPQVGYLLFNVSSAADVAAACKHGGQMKTDNGQHPCRIYFEAHTATAQALEKEREIKIGSLAWNTTNTNDYGDIQSITTTFNSKMTMKEALVIFNSATSVTQLKEEGATCLAVQDDVGTITRLGTVNVSYDPSLTVKLAGLPRGTTPADLKNIFDSEIKTPNVVRPYHTITMPFSLTTKTRQPEAYVRFSAFQQQQYALRTKIVLDGKETVWLNTNERTCFFCGRPSHFQQECDNFHAMLNQKATRRTNAAIIRVNASTFQHYFLAEQKRSFCGLFPSEKQRICGFQPHHHLLHSFYDGPSSFPRPQAAHPNSSVPATSTTDWTAYFNNQLAKVIHQHRADLESVRDDMATLNTKLDFLNGLGVMQTSVTTPFKLALMVEPKDVEITDATDCNVIVPDSIPLHHSQPPLPFNNPMSRWHRPTFVQVHQLLATIPTMHAPFAHTQLEAIPKRKETKSEMRAVATGSYQLSRRRGLTTDPKGKAPLRNQQQQAQAEHLDTSTTFFTPMTQIQLEQLVAVLRVENKVMKARIQSMSEQFQAREGAYKALQDRIEQQQAGDRTVIVHGEELQYASMTTSEIADYTGAPEIDSLGSTP
ncbi:hypothetical protein BGZ89_002060 [Linnemannia elongata]|nr:hypothetical protein BGZ89_002060 [Linnemannia elongata]